MEYFKHGLKSVLGSPQEGSQPSGAETVERLVNRVQSSTLLDDRRDACRALKALSRTYRIEVGAQGMDALRQVLEMDRGDCEIVGYALDTLCNITAPDMFEDEAHPNLSPGSIGSVGEQFTEIFIKHPDNVGLVLGFLEEYDFHVRWPAVKLLTSLVTNRPKDIQEIILVSPMGVSKLMDLLGDSREVIRNDALLLLIQLTKGNANIQKIVAFENAFDRLFDVIAEEGYSDGGIIVEDCLLLMLNLLRNNTSNQNFFKEGSYIQRLAPLFNLPTQNDVAGWSAQKVANFHCLLQIVRTLVTPGNPAQVTFSSQKTMKACHLLEKLCSILMTSGVPADILTETISTVGEVIRGNQSNQEYFASVMAPSNPPRPAVVVLLMSMVNEKQPFFLRCAVLYCFQCYLFKNEMGQSQLVQTLLPSSAEVSSLTSGQLLCGGLFSADPLSNWFSAVALSHALVENPVEKEQLLNVLLATNIGTPPVSLLHQCTMLLQQVNKVQPKLGLLMLLSTWLSHCPLAVKQFLSIPNSIPYLTAQIASNEHEENEELVQGMCAFVMAICIYFNDDTVNSYSKGNLRQLIEKRLGLEVFLDKLGEISKHESYSKAAKQPQLKPKHANELLLDHEFCRLFKALEGMMVKAVTPKPQGDLENGVSELTLSATENSLVRQYKDLIREQDRKLQELSQTAEMLKSEKASLLAQLEELKSTLSVTRDENMLLRVQNKAGMAQGINGDVAAFDEMLVLRKQLEEAKEEIPKLQMKNEEQSATICELEAKLQCKQASNLESKPEMICTSTTSAESGTQVEKLHKELQDTKEQLERAKQRIVYLESVASELEKIKADQDDLLELLSDQENRLNQYKKRLQQLGEMVEDEDENEEDNEDCDDEVASIEEVQEKAN